jgi:hypothetical protein
MIKRIMSITLVIALVLSQSTLAGAFVSDGTVGPFTAGTTVGGAIVADLSVLVKTVVGGATVSTLDWAGVSIGDAWEVSTQYLEVTYAANQVGWGVQIYTDNLSVYDGDPYTDPSQQPAGLIGVDNAYLTCPMAIMVTNTAIAEADIETPVTTSTADLPVLDPNYATITDPDYREWFTTGYDEIPGGSHEKVWFWLKDVSGTVGDDLDGDGVWDLSGVFGDPGFELVAGFSTTGDDYATIVSSLGSSSGWAAAVGGEMQRDGSSSSPINVYVAADFTNATELQEYKTDTIELEIYHE